MEAIESARPVREAPSRIAAEPATEPCFPVQFDVVTRAHSYRAAAISANALTFVGPDPLLPNWLAELTLAGDFEPLVMLANIKTCEAVNGEHVLTAQPFALAGPVKAHWMHLLEQARGA